MFGQVRFCLEAETFSFQNHTIYSTELSAASFDSNIYYSCPVQPLVKKDSYCLFFCTKSSGIRLSIVFRARWEGKCLLYCNNAWSSHILGLEFRASFWWHCSEWPLPSWPPRSGSGTTPWGENTRKSYFYSNFVEKPSVKQFEGGNCRRETKLLHICSRF